MILYKRSLRYIHVSLILVANTGIPSEISEMVGHHENYAFRQLTHIEDEFILMLSFLNDPKENKCFIKVKKMLILAENHLFCQLLRLFGV